MKCSAQILILLHPLFAVIIVVIMISQWKAKTGGRKKTCFRRMIVTIWSVLPIRNVAVFFFPCCSCSFFHGNKQNVNNSQSFGYLIFTARGGTEPTKPPTTDSSRMIIQSE
jgi:hypothetical protein